MRPKYQNILPAQLNVGVVRESGQYSRLYCEAPHDFELAMASSPSMRAASGGPGSARLIATFSSINNVEREVREPWLCAKFYSATLVGSWFTCVDAEKTRRKVHGEIYKYYRAYRYSEKYIPEVLEQEAARNPDSVWRIFLRLSDA